MSVRMLATILYSEAFLELASEASRTALSGETLSKKLSGALVMLYVASMSDIARATVSKLQSSGFREAISSKPHLCAAIESEMIRSISWAVYVHLGEGAGRGGPAA